MEYPWLLYEDWGRDSLVHVTRSYYIDIDIHIYMYYVHIHMHVYTCIPRPQNTNRIQKLVQYTPFQDSNKHKISVDTH